MQQNVLQKLYPHLRFNHITPPTHSSSEPPPIVKPVPPVIEKPVIVEKPIEKPVEREKSPTIEKSVEKPKKSKKKITIKEPSPKKNSPKPEKPPSPIKTPKSSGCTKQVVDRAKPIRESQIPQKGEKGLQRKYTSEQRKDMYLNKLSRKSVKKAEEEVGRVNEVLERNNNSPTQLSKEEKDIKKRLRLINTAKLFVVKDSIDKNVTPESHRQLEEGNMSTQGETRKEDELSSEASETGDESD